MNGNGSERLDRIERLLESMAERHEADHRELKSILKAQNERMDAIFDHHDEEFEKLLKWQVVTQSHIDDMLRSQKVEREASRVRDERIDKLVSAIGKLIERLPPVPGN